MILLLQLLFTENPGIQTLPYSQVDLAIFLITRALTEQAKTWVDMTLYLLILIQLYI